MDRFTVQAWCLDVAHTREKQWGTHTIRYVNKDVAHPAQYCHATSINATLASVHIYGSAPTGPYFGGFKSSEADLFADTPARMAKAWELYLKEFGRMPDLVYLHTAQWDLRGLSSLHGNNLSLAANASFLANFTSSFRDHLHDRIQDVLGLIRASIGSGFGTKTRLGLRTAAFSIHVDNGFLQDSLNEVIRHTVATHPARLLLFDMDRDLWSREGFARSREAQSNLFRDFIHPREHFLAAAGSKMLGAEYSRWAFGQQSGGEAYVVATPQTELARPPAQSLAPLLLRRDLVVRLVQHNTSLYLATIVGAYSTVQPPANEEKVASFRCLFHLPPDAVATVTRWLTLGPSEMLVLPHNYTLANSTALRIVPLPPLHLLTTGGGNPLAKESGPTKGVRTSLGEVFVLSYAAGGLKFGGIRRVAGDLQREGLGSLWHSRAARRVARL